MLISVEKMHASAELKGAIYVSVYHVIYIFFAFSLGKVVSLIIALPPSVSRPEKAHAE